MTGRGYNGTSVLNVSPHWAVRREPREGEIPMRGIANARLIYSESSGRRGQKRRDNHRLILQAGDLFLHKMSAFYIQRTGFEGSTTSPLVARL